MRAPTLRSARLVWQLAWSSVILASCAARDAAQATSTETPGEAAVSVPHREPAAPLSRLRIWEYRIGDGFRKGSTQVGIALGPGSGTHLLGSKRTHDLALVTVHFSRVFSDVMAENRWYRGNAEWGVELFAGPQFTPAHRSVVGIIPLLRYNFATGSPWIPFVNGGVGVAYTNVRDRDLNGGLEFNVQVGAGAHYFFRENRALTWQYRWFHLSNGGLSRPNSGVNTHMFFAGLSWFL